MKPAKNEAGEEVAGWGESFMSCVTRSWVDSDKAQVSGFELFGGFVVLCAITFDLCGLIGFLLLLFFFTRL